MPPINKKCMIEKQKSRFFNQNGSIAPHLNLQQNTLKMTLILDPQEKLFFTSKLKTVLLIIITIADHHMFCTLH